MDLEKQVFQHWFLKYLGEEYDGPMDIHTLAEMERDAAEAFVKRLPKWGWLRRRKIEKMWKEINDGRPF